MQVARVLLHTELFDNVSVSGPVPLLFSSDQSAAFEGLMKHSELTLQDLHKLNSRFFLMEHLSMEDAFTYLQGPAKKAKGRPAFPPPTPEEEPSNKKRKPSASTPKAPASSSGNNFSFHYCLFSHFSHPSPYTLFNSKFCINFTFANLFLTLTR